MGFLVGVTGERVIKTSGLGWGDGKHPCITDNEYDNPFWNEASLMLTNKGNMHRCNMFKLCAAHGERAQWFGDKATLYMEKGGLHSEALKFRTKTETETRYDLPIEKDGELVFPDYFKSDMLPKPMRHKSGHGNSHTFLSAEFINALLEDREPAIDVYDALAMTVPGIIAHQSAMNSGEQMVVPQFDR
jgi:hypothetical protein